MQITFIFAIFDAEGADRYWVAGVSGNWKDTNNWSATSGGAGGASEPGVSDHVYFDANGLGDCNVDGNVSILGMTVTNGYSGNIIQQNGYTFTVGSGNWVQHGGTFTAETSTITVNGNLTLNNAILTHSDNSTTLTHALNLVVNGDLTLNNSAQINADGLGYDADNGPGAPTNGSGDGGAHGGIGGDNDLDGNTSSVYDMLSNEIGSGGDEASGGGIMDITVSGALIVDVLSSITTNGADGNGAGAGGSLDIEAGTITMAGTIAANGGNSTNGGGGGGGRIWMVLTTASADFTNVTGTISAYGGDSDEADEDGAAGTVYLEEEADVIYKGEIIIDNNNLNVNESTVYTPIISGQTWQIEDLVLRNKAVFYCPSGTTFKLLTNSITSNDSENKIFIEGLFNLIPSNLNIDNWQLHLKSDLTFSSTDILSLLNNGKIFLNGLELSLLNPSTTALSADATSYIVDESQTGGIIWDIDESTGTYTFPFATTSGVKIPIVFDVTSAGVASSVGKIKYSTYPTADNNSPLPGSVPSNSDYLMAIDRFWVLDLIDYQTEPQIDFTYNYDENDLSGNSFVEDDLAFEIYDEGLGNWSQFSGTLNAAANTLDISSSSITLVSLQSQFVWTMGTVDAPLPIELLDFSANYYGDLIELSWITSSEINNDYFTLEKSYDGRTFKSIKQIAGAGNSTQELHYSHVDRETREGINYYRLKQTDFDGTFAYSDIIAIAGSDLAVEQSFSTFPNPVTDNYLYIQSNIANYNEQIEVVISDLNGAIIERVVVQQGEKIILNEYYKNGLYMVSTVSENTQYVSVIIVSR